MMLDLDEIEKRCEKATPGPWLWTSPYEGAEYQRVIARDGSTVMDDGSACGEYSREIDPDGSDGQFISHARTDIPALLQFAKDAKAALEFYGDKENWATDDLCRETGNKTFDIILFDFDRNYSRGKDLAGRKAREVLTRYFGDE